MLHRKSRNLIIASGLALALSSLGTTTAFSETTQSLTDVRQEAQIWTSYALNPHLRVHDLHATVKDGKATITGTVQDDLSKELANEMARGVDGITEVDNQIEVVSDLPRDREKGATSFGQGIDDATITATVKSKLMWSKYTSGLATTVQTKSGRVYLTGSADSAEAKRVAGSLAADTRGVVSVSNALTVSPPTPATQGSDASITTEVKQEISDSWITAKVKLNLLYSSNVAGNDVHVSTDAGVVTLTGQLNSAAEKSLAVELTQNVLGVKSVEAAGLTVSGEGNMNNN